MPEQHPTERTVFFSDAVVAIAMTLLALDLPVPSGGTAGEIARRAWANAGDYGAFLISFYAVGGAWQAHHQLFTRIRRVDSAAMQLNLTWLLLVVITPFATRVLTGGEESTSTGVGVRFATWSLVQALAGLALLRLARRVRRNGGFEAGAAAWLRHWQVLRAVASAMFVLAAGLAFASPWAAGACWAGTPLVLRGTRGLLRRRDRRASAQQRADDDRDDQGG